MMEQIVILISLILASSNYASAFAIPKSSFEETNKSNLSLSNNQENHAFVILGATGDLARREIYPALWYLYRDYLLPPKTIIYGYANSAMNKTALRDRIAPFIVVKPEHEKLYEQFWTTIREVIGSNKTLQGHEREVEGYDRLCRTVQQEADGNRIFYLALPPAIFANTTTQIKRACVGEKGWTRLVIEKPFGHDLESSEELSSHVSKLFDEDQIYRIDHFLGYEMVQNILTLRFGNRLLYSDWSKDNIAAVEVDFKENFGIEGRAAFFDANGIIRDVMQNHLLQILSLIAMDKPKSSHTDDVRDEKVKLLKSTQAIEINDTRLGQYVGNPNSTDEREQKGYREEDEKLKDSIQSTFAMTVLKIDNERWDGVPFIIRAGKGLNINQTDVIIQFKDIKDGLFEGKTKRNKLVIRIGKTKSLMANIMSKSPGFTNDVEEITIDFHYDDKYKGFSMPDAYERLILDTFSGSQLNFVRSDELREAWRIFTPILHKIEKDKIKPEDYIFGTTGPKSADELERFYNFI